MASGSGRLRSSLIGAFSADTQLFIKENSETFLYKLKPQLSTQIWYAEEVERLNILNSFHKSLPNLPSVRQEDRIHLIQFDTFGSIDENLWSFMHMFMKTIKVNVSSSRLLAALPDTEKKYNSYEWPQRSTIPILIVV